VPEEFLALELRAHKTFGQFQEFLNPMPPMTRAIRRQESEPRLRNPERVRSSLSRKEISRAEAPFPSRKKIHFHHGKICICSDYRRIRRDALPLQPQQHDAFSILCAGIDDELSMIHEMAVDDDGNKKMCGAWNRF
jgi:hypothetical protein